MLLRLKSFWKEFTQKKHFCLGKFTNLHKSNYTVGIIYLNTIFCVNFKIWSLVDLSLILVSFAKLHWVGCSSVQLNWDELSKGCLLKNRLKLGMASTMGGMGLGLTFFVPNLIWNLKQYLVYCQLFEYKPFINIRLKFYIYEWKSVINLDSWNYDFQKIEYSFSSDYNFINILTIK